MEVEMEKVKVKGLRSTNWQLPIEHSAGNKVNNFVMAMCGARLILDILGHHITHCINF